MTQTLSSTSKRNSFKQIIIIIIKRIKKKKIQLLSFDTPVSQSLQHWITGHRRTNINTVLYWPEENNYFPFFSPKHSTTAYTVEHHRSNYGLEDRIHSSSVSQFGLFLVRHLRINLDVNIWRTLKNRMLNACMLVGNQRINKSLLLLSFFLSFFFFFFSQKINPCRLQLNCTRWEIKCQSNWHWKEYIC